MSLLPFARKRSPAPSQPAATPPEAPKPPRAYALVPPTSIVARRNPRHGSVEQLRVDALAESLVETGQLEPIEVRPLGKDDPRRREGAEYELVFGERRWRAALAKQLPTIEVLIKEMTDEEAANRALVENQQRAAVTVWSLYTECIERHAKGQSVEDIARLAHLNVRDVRDFLTIATLPPDISEKLSGSCDATTLRRMLQCAQVGKDGIGQRGRWEAQRRWWDEEVNRPLIRPHAPSKGGGKSKAPARVRASTILNYAANVERYRLVYDHDTGLDVPVPPELAKAVANTFRRWCQPSVYGPSPADAQSPPDDDE